MGAINTTVFGGMVPAVDTRLLPDTAAAEAENAWLYSGKLIGLPEYKTLHTGASATNYAYRIPKAYSNSAYMYDSTWLEFENPDTTIVRSPVHDDAHDRHYWVSSTEDPKYNTLDRILNGDGAWMLGVPTPGSVSVAPAGGTSSTTVSRAYAVTWVSAYGEEGAPATTDAVTGKQDDTWTVTLPTPAAGDLGVARNLTTARIYRTITSSAGVATYFFVAEVDIEDGTYDDTATDAEVSANDQLESAAWTPPPADLQGFLLMPNGIMASWRDNELWFSEAYRPHAWPAAYVLTTEYPIVGLGIVNQTLVVCTLGYPVTAYGSNPAYITTSSLTTHEPCISRGSIVSSPEGVYYASPNGLVLVVPGRAENITRDLVTRDTWDSLTAGAPLRAARLGTGYFAFGTVQPGVFNEDSFDEDSFAQEDFAGAYVGLLIDPHNRQVAMSLLSSDTPVSSVSPDPWSGDVLIVRGGEVEWLDMRDDTPTYEPARWRSKVYQTQDKANFGAMRVYFEVPDNTPTQNPVRNTNTEQTLAADQYGLVRLWADDRLVMTRELRTSGELWKLPAGFKADYWQFEVEARVKVLSVQVASSTKELGRV